MILLLLFISFSAYAVMWTLQFHFNNSIFRNLNPQYWNPVLSWENKWQQVKIFGKRYPMRGSDGERVEKFPGSSTIFVWLTDAFHLFQSIFLNSLFLAFGFMADGNKYSGVNFVWWEAFIGIRLIYALVFEGLFGWLLIKK